MASKAEAEKGNELGKSNIQLRRYIHETFKNTKYDSSKRRNNAPIVRDGCMA